MVWNGVIVGTLLFLVAIVLGYLRLEEGAVRVVFGLDVYTMLILQVSTKSAVVGDNGEPVLGLARDAILLDEKGAQRECSH